jgi:hypothetical protein
MTASVNNAAASVASRLEAALLGGGDTETALRDVAAICGSDADAHWEVLALVDQYYRRGRISDATFRAINTQVQRMAIGGPMLRMPKPDATPGRAPAATAVNATGAHSSAAAVKRPAPAGARMGASASATGAHPVRFQATGAQPIGTRPPGNLATEAHAISTLATGAHAASARPATRPTPVSAAEPAAHAAPEMAVASPSYLGPGSVLVDRYVIEAPIDYGTADAVYRAVDRFRADMPHEDQRVAVKIPVNAAEAHRQFFRAQEMTQHNVARVLECGPAGPLSFYTLEFHRGKLLRDVLRELKEPLPKPFALSIVREVGAAIVYAHGIGIVHGRLDTSSVLITIDGGVRVLNFDALPAEPPPEPRHDLHSLACTAYELLAGKPPFPERDATAARQKGARAKRPPGLRYRPWRTLRQGLAWSSRQRSPSVKEWLSQIELERAAPTLPPLARLLAAPPQRRWRGVAITAAVAATVVASVLVLTLFDGSGPPARIVPAADTAAIVPTASAASAAATPDAPPAAIPAAANPVGDAKSVAITAPAVAGPGRIGFMGASLTVPQDAAAARVVVHRIGGTRGDIGFDWWTEDGSARAGEDFVTFGTRHMTIADGKDSVTLFVPLVAPASHPGRTDFYVVLGGPTGGAGLGTNTRTVVNLTPRS